MSNKDYPMDMRLSFEIKDGKVLWSYYVGNEHQVGEDAIGLDDVVCFVRLLEIFDRRWKHKQEKQDRDWIREGVKREMDAQKSSSACDNATDGRDDR